MDHAVYAVAEDLRGSAGVRADSGDASGHRLNQGERMAFEPAREQKQVAGLEYPRDVVAMPECEHPVSQALPLHRRLELLPERTVSGPDEEDVRPGFQNVARDLQQIAVALLLFQPCHRRDDSRLCG